MDVRADGVGVRAGALTIAAAAPRASARIATAQPHRDPTRNALDGAHDTRGSADAGDKETGILGPASRAGEEETGATSGFANDDGSLSPVAPAISRTPDLVGSVTGASIEPR